MHLGVGNRRHCPVCGLAIPFTVPDDVPNKARAFGWVTEKELIRYTRDFDREAEAVGMLIKLKERRKAG